MTMYDIVSLGEMMLCLSAPKYQRLRHTTSLNVRVCGAQFNIAANFASLGRKSAFLTALPANEMGYLAESIGAGYGVDMSHTVFLDEARMGLIFLEYGREPRRHSHIYDRGQSAASKISATTFVWPEILSGAKMAYADGILPALNRECRQAIFAYLNAAKEAGCTTCFDVNYRESLWQSAAAAEFYRAILPQVDVLVTGRTFSEDLLGYSGSDEDILRAYQREFGCSTVCLTYRNMQGMTRGSWRSMALSGDQIVNGREFDFAVVDQFGTGDAFFAGFLHGILEKDVRYGLDFGNAFCALAHTIDGDPAIFSRDEVESLLGENYSLITRR
jgi:2-dehydro-3-deoxygluconokinase